MGLYAQKNIPAFGKVDKEDLLMTDCSFDKGSDAFMLFDWGSTYYDKGSINTLFNTIFERRTRIKILKEKGIALANVEIPFYNFNNEEKVLKINAVTINMDESGKVYTTEVRKNLIYTKRINAYYSKVIFAFPAVKVGSVIEYTYTIERETMSNIPTWYFQGRIPVRYSEYQLKIPQIFRFSVLPAVIDSIEDKQEVISELITSSSGTVVKTPSVKCNYIMRNLPGIKDEPFMGSAKDYMQRLEFQLSQIVYDNNQVQDIGLKWKDVIEKQLAEDEGFGLQLTKNISTSAPLISEAIKIIDNETRMKFIYEAVRKNFIWNEEYDIYTGNGIEKTWDLKTGNTADINLLLTKLLNDAGIKADPILFSTKNNGLVSPLYPSVRQFNTVMAYIKIGEKVFVLDATDKFINYKLVPEKVVNSRGFLPEGENGKWLELLAGKYKYKVVTAVQGEIDESGIMKGNALVNCYDYARAQRVAEFAKDAVKFKEDHFVKYYKSLQVQDLTVNNIDSDSLPLEQKIKFASVLNRSGDYRYFSVNLFSDLDTNPFITQNRVLDIDFAVQQDYTIFGNFTIPADYVFDELPAAVALTTSDKSIIFNRFVSADGNLLNIKMTLEFKSPFYEASSYAEVKEFYKKMFEKLHEQVVIKKKATL